MESLSSLELFLLTAISAGSTTAYELNIRAGLSVGSVNPALARMVESGLLRVETSAGGRRRMQHVLTAAGKKSLLKWQSVVDAAVENPPLDIDHMLRLIAISWHFRDRERCRLLITSWKANSELKKTSPPEIGDGIGFYKWAQTVANQERLAAANQTLRIVGRQVPTKRPRRQK